MNQPFIMQNHFLIQNTMQRSSNLNLACLGRGYCNIDVFLMFTYFLIHMGNQPWPCTWTFWVQVFCELQVEGCKCQLRVWVASWELWVWVASCKLTCASCEFKNASSNLWVDKCELRVSRICKLKIWEYFKVWVSTLKGHWTTSASSPNFFQKSWDFYIIRSVYLGSDCMLNLTCSFNSVTKIYAFFFQ